MLTPEAEFRVYDHLSPEFTTKTDVHQGCLLPLFYFNFFFEMSTGMTLSLDETNGMVICLDKKVFDLEYAKDLVLHTED